MPTSAADVLSTRALNRATLERQLLLRRWDIPATEAMARLAGMNAQDPNPPYIGLWTRLADFGHDALTQLLYDRSVVRGSMMRGAQHMVVADDYLAWRSALQPVLESIQRGHHRRGTPGIDPADLAAAGRELMPGRTLTRPELGKLLAERWPDASPVDLARSVQMLVPLIHPPPSGTWDHHGATPFVLAEEWLGQPMATKTAPEQLILRYLAAFGPASVKDMQAWSGLTRLRAPVEDLGARLRPFRDEHDIRLYDLPDAPRPDPDAPAPPRFLPPVDNLMVAHDDRTRVMTDEQRKRVCIGAVVEPTILLDGRVLGIWRIVRDHDTAILEIESLAPLGTEDRTALTDEGLRLLTFATAGSDAAVDLLDVRFTSP